jgi:solute carrier family 45, member 1/2/4
MWLTLFVNNIPAATVLVGLVGIPWAITGWIPFALISQEISKRDAMRRGIHPQPSSGASAAAAGTTMSSARPGSRMSNHSGTLSRLSDEEDDLDPNNSDGEDQAGVILGIHNVAIAAPQVIATLVSSLIFKALQKGRSEPGDTSVAWVLRFGGLCAIAAAYLTRYVGEEGSEEVRERRID